MFDIHSHILPGVDDGARDLEESLAMLEAAKAVGVTAIACTPHCRDPYFDYGAMCEAFELLERHAEGFPLVMGFEVNHAKLMELGDEWIDRLAFRGRKEFLLELSTRAGKATFDEYERTIFEIKAKGYRVIIAHPERYLAIQKDFDRAKRLVDIGCELQVSANFVAGGRFGREKKPAKKLFDGELVSYIASDAHCAEDYKYLLQARRGKSSKKAV